MAGERDLGKLLRHMTPRLQSGSFVFCSFADHVLPAGLNPIATFHEAEGLSAIVAKDEAQGAGVPYRSHRGRLVAAHRTGPLRPHQPPLPA